MEGALSAAIGWRLALSAAIGLRAALSAALGLRLEVGGKGLRPMEV